MCCSCFGDLDFPALPGTAPKDGAGFRGKGDYYLLLISTVTVFVNFTGANSLSSAYL